MNSTKRRSFTASPKVGQIFTNLLFKVVQRVAGTDLHPAKVSNHDMGLVFEELIRRFAEGSNETAGEHFAAGHRAPDDLTRVHGGRRGPA